MSELSVNESVPSAEPVTGNKTFILDVTSVTFDTTYFFSQDQHATHWPSSTKKIQKLSLQRFQVVYRIFGFTWYCKNNLEFKGEISLTPKNENDWNLGQGHQNDWMKNNFLTTMSFKFSWNENLRKSLGKVPSYVANAGNHFSPSHQAHALD